MKKLTSFTLLSFPKSESLIAYETESLSVNWCWGWCFSYFHIVKVAFCLSRMSLMFQTLQSGLFCSVRRRNGGGSKVFWGKSMSLQSDKASGTPLPMYIPELNTCIVVAMMMTMSVSVITETACAHAHTVAFRQRVHCSWSQTAC